MLARPVRGPRGLARRGDERAAGDDQKGHDDEAPPDELTAPEEECGEDHRPEHARSYERGTTVTRARSNRVA